MRNPIRSKNLNYRFAPYYLAGIPLLVFSHVSWETFALGSVPIAAGLALRTWGAGHLIKNDRFTVTGPYAYLRHPLYLGTILCALGFALILGGWVTLGVLAVVGPWFFLSYFPRKERVEGARLERLYGQSYRDYRREVPALLPRIAPWRPSRGSIDGQVGEGGAGGRVCWTASCWDENNEHGALLAGLLGLGLLAVRASIG